MATGQLEQWTTRAMQKVEFQKNKKVHVDVFVKNMWHYSHN